MEKHQISKYIVPRAIHDLACFLASRDNLANKSNVVSDCRGILCSSRKSPRGIITVILYALQIILLR